MHSPTTPPAAPAHRAGQRRPLSRPARIALILFGVLAVTAIGAVSAIAYAAHAVMTSPSIEVRVHDKMAGSDIHVAVPAGLVKAGIHVAPWVMPDEALAEMRFEIEAGLREAPFDVGQLAHALLDDLEAMPDATLVEVQDGVDHVEVAKRGDELHVTVRSPDADVEVVVPLDLFDKALAFIDV